MAEKLGATAPAAPEDSTHVNSADGAVEGPRTTDTASAATQQRGEDGQDAGVVARPTGAAQAPLVALSSHSASAPTGPHYLDADLRPWKLYELSGAVAPDSEDTMIAYWHRYRALRGKSSAGEYHALQYSWCAFIKRWNERTELGQAFVTWLEIEEEKRRCRSLGALREKVCTMSWDAERVCFVEVVEGCRHCEVGGTRRTRSDWDSEVAARPLSDDERWWIARYESVLYNTRRAAASRGETPLGRSTAARSDNRPADQDARVYRARGRDDHQAGRGDEQSGRSSSRERGGQGHKRGRSRSPSVDRRVRQRVRSPSQVRPPRGEQTPVNAYYPSPSPPATRSSRRRQVSAPGQEDWAGGWSRTHEQGPAHPARAAHAAPTYPHQVGIQASERDTGAAHARRYPGYDWARWDEYQARRGQQADPLSSESRRWSQQAAEGRRGGTDQTELASRDAALSQHDRIVLAESEQARNDAADAMEQAQRAEDVASAAEDRAQRAEQRSANLLERIRDLERQMGKES